MLIAAGSQPTPVTVTHSGRAQCHVCELWTQAGSSGRSGEGQPLTPDPGISGCYPAPPPRAPTGTVPVYRGYVVAPDRTKHRYTPSPFWAVAAWWVRLSDARQRRIQPIRRAFGL
jgi:hypothetical protein